MVFRQKIAAVFFLSWKSGALRCIIFDLENNICISSRYFFPFFVERMSVRITERRVANIYSAAAREMKSYTPYEYIYRVSKLNGGAY